MSYLNAARRAVTFRYHNKNFPDFEHNIPLSYQKQCEEIRDSLFTVSAQNMHLNGCDLDEFTIADFESISSIILKEGDIHIELYIDTKRKPYHLREKSDQKYTVLDLDNKECLIEITYHPCIDDACPMAIVAPGKTFV